MNRQLLKTWLTPDGDRSPWCLVYRIMESIERAKSPDPLQEMILGLLLQAMRDQPG
jgi:hypothetical protein